MIVAVVLSLVMVLASASADLDVTACDGLRALVTTLREGETEVLLAQVRGAVRDRLRTSGLMREVGEAHFFASVADAVDYWLAQPRSADAPLDAGHPAPVVDETTDS